MNKPIEKIHQNQKKASLKNYPDTLIVFLAAMYPIYYSC